MEEKNWRISTTKPIQYDIVCSNNIFNPQNNLLLSNGAGQGSRRFIVLDHALYKSSAERIKTYFNKHNVDVKIFDFHAGEENKSIQNYLSILEELDAFKINRRNEPIIAIGGGVLTDLVGFVASSYRRGVPHIKVPTTLMGYVDASIGIKTGVNFYENKNRIGAYEPPQKVILDRSFFLTLPERHILNGVDEIVKLAIIKHLPLFELLESHGEACIKSKFQDNISILILNHAIESMIEELEPNLFEDSLARAADFGHTFSPILEMQKDSELLHGEAVVIDIALSSILSFIKKSLAKNDLDRILNILFDLELFVPCDFIDPNLFWTSLQERTRHRDGLQRVPLPYTIGKYIIVNDIQFDELCKACDFLKKWMDEKWPVLPMVI